MPKIVQVTAENHADKFVARAIWPGVEESEIIDFLVTAGTSCAVDRVPS